MAGFFSTIQNVIATILEKVVAAFGIKPPTAIVTGVQIPSIDLHQVTLSFSLLVTNPSRLPIPLTDVSYALESHSRKLLSAAVTQAQTIQSNTSATIVLPVTFVYQDILKTVVDLRPGSVVPYKINVDFAVDVPCLGRKKVAFDYSGVFPIPQVPIILLEKMEFRKFSFEECEVSLQLKVKNTNEFEMGISSLELQLQLSSITIGSAGLEKEKAATARVGKSGESWVEVPISFRPKNLGDAVWEVLAGQQTTYNIEGSIGAETVFGSIRFPFSQGGSASMVK